MKGIYQNNYIHTCILVYIRWKIYIRIFIFIPVFWYISGERYISEWLYFYLYFGIYLVKVYIRMIILYMYFGINLVKGIYQNDYIIPVFWYISGERYISEWLYLYLYSISGEASIHTGQSLPNMHLFTPNS